MESNQNESAAMCMCAGSEDVGHSAWPVAPHVSACGTAWPSNRDSDFLAQKSYHFPKQFPVVGQELVYLLLLLGC